MHKLFGEWYRLAKIEPTDDLLGRRWQGIENFLQTSAGRVPIFDLVRLFLGREPKDHQLIGRFREVFQGADLAFPMSGNDLELQVLAGAVLAVCWEKPEKGATEAALAMTCAGFQGVTPLAPLRAIVDMATKYLEEKSLEARSVKSPAFHALSISPNEIIGNLATVVKSNDPAQIGQAVVEALNRTSAGIVQISELLNGAVTDLSLKLIVQGEQSDIQWWVFAEYSNDLNCRMADLALAIACLAAGKELADLVRLMPGPFASRAFLEKILRAGRNEFPSTITLREAVKGTDSAWNRRWLNERPFEAVKDFCPVHYAIFLSGEAGGNENWIPPFEASMHRGVSEPVPPVTLALQTFQEGLLIKAVNQGG